MFKKNILMASAILFIGISIIISGYCIGEGIKSVNIGRPATTTKDTKVLNLTQAANYLNMPEEEVKAVIQIEKNELEKTGSFSGRRLPYFTIDSKQYFYKDEIDEWLKDVSSNNREYNTTEGWVL